MIGLARRRFSRSDSGCRDALGDQPGESYGGFVGFLLIGQHPSEYRACVKATTKLYTPATSKDNGRASSHCGLIQRDKLREKKEDEGICQFILTIDITTVKWES